MVENKHVTSQPTAAAGGGGDDAIAKQDLGADVEEGEGVVTRL